MKQEVNEISQALKDMGEEIRLRRESLGLSIENVRNTTLIRTKYLLAIEDGNDKEIPGTAYFKGFLKSYANALGLDGFAFSRAYQELLDKKEYLRKHPKERSRTERVPVRRSEPAKLTKRETPTPDGAEVGRRPRTRTRRAGKKNPTFFIFLLLFIMAFGVYYGSRLGIFSKETCPVSESDDPEDSQNGEEAFIPEPPPPPLPTVLRTDPDYATTVWEVDVTPLALVLEVADQEDAVCWVKVIQDGETVFEGNLKRAETRQFNATEYISIRAGKPWVLSLNLCDIDLGAGGPFGPVKDLIFRMTPNS